MAAAAALLWLAAALATLATFLIVRRLLDARVRAILPWHSHHRVDADLLVWTSHAKGAVLVAKRSRM
jgi:hypothetical protein